jgi:hypothetical protein
MSWIDGAASFGPVCGIRSPHVLSFRQATSPCTLCTRKLALDIPGTASAPCPGHAADGFSRSAMMLAPGRDAERSMNPAGFAPE